MAMVEKTLPNHPYLPSLNIGTMHYLLFSACFRIHNHCEMHPDQILLTAVSPLSPAFYLWIAAARNKKDVLRCLVECGVDINSSKLCGPAYKGFWFSAVIGMLGGPFLHSFLMLRFLVEELHTSLPIVEISVNRSLIEIFFRFCQVFQVF